MPGLRVCSACGQANFGASDTCEACGAALDPAPVSARSQRERQRAKGEDLDDEVPPSNPPLHRGPRPLVARAGLVSAIAGIAMVIVGIFYQVLQPAHSCPPPRGCTTLTPNEALGFLVLFAGVGAIGLGMLVFIRYVESPDETRSLEAGGTRRGGVLRVMDHWLILSAFAVAFLALFTALVVPLLFSTSTSTLIEYVVEMACGVIIGVYLLRRARTRAQALSVGGPSEPDRSTKAGAAHVKIPVVAPVTSRPLRSGGGETNLTGVQLRGRGSWWRQPDGRFRRFRITGLAVILWLGILGLAVLYATLVPQPCPAPSNVFTFSAPQYDQGTLNTTNFAEYSLGLPEGPVVDDYTKLSLQGPGGNPLGPASQSCPTGPPGVASRCNASSSGWYVLLVDGAGQWVDSFPASATIPNWADVAPTTIVAGDAFWVVSQHSLQGSHDTLNISTSFRLSYCYSTVLDHSPPMSVGSVLAVSDARVGQRPI